MGQVDKVTDSYNMFDLRVKNMLEKEENDNERIMTDEMAKLK